MALRLSPGLAVTGEFLRALCGVLRLPFHLQDYLARRAAMRSALTADLGRPSPVVEPSADVELPDRPLRVFVSCAEASGEIHASNLVAELRARIAERGAPEPELLGLGGRRLADLGVRIVGDPVERAAMGIGGVLPSIPFYLGLLSRSAREFAGAPPDLFLPVDSPALHVPLAHLAKRYGVPVVHFVTPQYWGWAPWRVSGYRKAVDRALTILPFEPSWFARHGVETQHVGHPLLDELSAVPSTRPDAASRTLVLLPGSRASVIEKNLPWMLHLAGLMRRRHPELELSVAQSGEDRRDRIESILARCEGPPVKLATGNLHETLAGARAALSVSGTVVIDLLHHRLPAVVVYRVNGRRGTWMYRNLLTAPFFTSVNLLVGRELYPELCFHGDGPLDRALEALERATFDEPWRAACRRGLDEAAGVLGPPGAVARAAGAALEVAAGAPRAL